MNINLGKMHLNRIKASWYNPRSGLYTEIGNYEANGIKTFNPPDGKSDRNDWVLVLDRI
jgi:hypothetical protein